MNKKEAFKRVSASFLFIPHSLSFLRYGSTLNLRCEDILPPR